MKAKQVSVFLENKSGRLNEVVQILGNAEGIFIEYLYAFSINNDTAVIVIRPTDVNKCIETLEIHRDELLTNNDHYRV